MARLRDLVIDCEHPASLARFWAATLDDYEVAPYDEGELARLWELGIDGPEDDSTVLVEATGSRPRLWFQKVRENKVVKNRMHVDLAADDADAEVARLVSLGARPAAEQPNNGLIVMADPEGNEFCVLRCSPGGVACARR